MSTSFDREAADFQLSVTPVQDGVRAVALSGSLDFASVESALPGLLELLPGTAVLALDTTRVEFCDVAGLRLLVRLHEQGRAGGCQVVMCAASPVVDWLLQLTEVAALFDYPPAEPSVCAELPSVPQASMPD